MKNEERLTRLETVVERFAERVDAMAQSVELLASMQRESEKRLTRLEDALATLAEGMALLTRSALDHGERIDRLEGNRPQ